MKVYDARIAKTLANKYKNKIQKKKDKKEIKEIFKDINIAIEEGRLRTLIYIGDISIEGFNNELIPTLKKLHYKIHKCHMDDFIDVSWDEAIEYND